MDKKHSPAGIKQRHQTEGILLSVTILQLRICLNSVLKMGLKHQSCENPSCRIQMTEACPRQTVSLQTFMQVNNHAHEWSYCFPVDEAGLGPVPGCTGDGNVGNQHNQDFGQSERLMLGQKEGADCFCWSRLSSATLLHRSNKNQDKHPCS